MDFPKEFLDYISLNKHRNFFGFGVYELDGQGLVGNWTNNQHAGNFMHEIAGKKDSVSGLIGNYVFAYLDFKNVSNIGELEINFNEQGGYYNLKWKDGDSPIFVGIGMETRRNQLSVFYWKYNK